MSKNTNDESDYSTPSEKDSDILKEHYALKAKLSSDIARLQQAGKDRDRRIDKLDASIGELRKDIASVEEKLRDRIISIKSRISWGMGAAAAIVFFASLFAPEIIKKIFS